MCGDGQPQLIEPAMMPLSPRTSLRRVHTLTQQELAQVMTFTHQCSLGVLARTHQIAKRFVLQVRHPHRREVTAAEQPGQAECVPVVGLDPVTRSSWGQRRCHHHRLDVQGGQLTVQVVAGRARLVRCDQACTPAQPRHRFAHLAWLIGDGAEQHRRPVGFGHRYRDGRLVHIQPQVPRCTLSHLDRPPACRLYARPEHQAVSATHVSARVCRSFHAD